MAPLTTPNTGKATEAPTNTANVAPLVSPVGIKGFSDEQIKLGDKTMPLTVVSGKDKRTFVAYKSVLVTCLNFFDK